MPLKQPVIFSLITSSFFFAGFLVVASIADMEVSDIALGLSVGLPGLAAVIFVLVRSRPPRHQRS